MALSVASVLLLGSTLITSSVAQLSDPALVGTWTTKSKSVLTGPGFYNPVTDKMTEPNHPGISYSFTADGFFEEAYYRTISNRESSTPICNSLQVVGFAKILRSKLHNLNVPLRFSSGSTESTP